MAKTARPEASVQLLRLMLEALPDKDGENR
jgi:hypothetical protein